MTEQEIKALEQEISYRREKFKENIGLQPQRSGYVMGMDISKRCTGIAILRKSDKALVEYLHYKPASSNIIDVAIEYAFLVDSLMNRFPNIENVIIEDTFMQGMGSAVKDLSLVHGGVILSLANYNVKKYKIANTSVKSYFGAKADKDNNIDAKEVLFNIIVRMYNLSNFDFKKHNDITDAIALAYNFDNTKVNAKARMKKGIKTFDYVPVLTEY